MLKKIFLPLLLIVLLMSRAEAGTWSPELRVGILSGVKQVSLKVSAPCVMLNAAKGNVLNKIPAGGSFTVDFERLKINAVEVRPEKVPIQELTIEVDGKKYYGGVSVNKGKDSLTVINLVPLEEYLHGVLAKEMSPSYPLEALKAQAVAARSFALKNRGRHVKEVFDLCSSTHCQVYVGVTDFDSINRAIDETRGAVLVYKEKLIDTNFHADSGGMTEDVADVWGRATPYLVAVREIVQLAKPWTVKVPAKDFSKQLDLDDVKTVKLSKLTVGQGASDRTSSGRVQSAQINGKKFTGTELRQKFSLPSTLFDMKLDDGEIIFTGYGRGHGVGMSQVGARDYAKEGWSYEKILKHYYKDTKLKKLY